ncbi:MAG: DinB family protein [Acidobacteriota bacterium]
MHSFLQARLDDLETARRQVDTLVAETTAEQRAWQPEPTSWSIDQVLAHLNVTAEQYHPRVQRLMDRLRSRGLTSNRLYRPSPFAKLFNYVAGPENNMKLKAPGKFVPPSAAPDTLERYRGQQEELGGLISQADGLDLNKLSLGSPITPLIRFSLGEALELLCVHQKRHLRQVEGIRKHPRFPPG